MERQHISELISLNDRMHKNGFSFQHQDYLLLRDILPEIVRSVKEDNKLRAKWFEKGQMSVKRKNQSGCCCIINDDGEVVSPCGAHQNWLEEQITE